MKHFGHLSRSCMKTRHNSVFSLCFQTFWPKSLNFLRSFQERFGLWPKIKQGTPTCSQTTPTYWQAIPIYWQTIPIYSGHTHLLTALAAEGENPNFSWKNTLRKNKKGVRRCRFTSKHTKQSALKRPIRKFSVCHFSPKVKASISIFVFPDEDRTLCLVVRYELQSFIRALKYYNYKLQPFSPRK